MYPAKLGCDPEFFLKKDGKFISAHDRVPGTKAQPHKLPNGGCVQADGVAVEFNIPPASTPKRFHDYILSALNDIRNEFFKDAKDIKFAFEPVAMFDRQYFNSLPEKALELGCEPDYCAYVANKPNPKPVTKEPMRTGSGHIHVGFLKPKEFVKNPHTDEQHIDDCRLLTFALDMSFMNNKPLWDPDVKRSSLYGKIGCYRPKAYGLEYRTMSNAWLNYPNMWPWIFNNTMATINGLLDGEVAKDLSNQHLSDCQYYLNHMIIANNINYRRNTSYDTWINNGTTIPLNKLLLKKKLEM